MENHAVGSVFHLSAIGQTRNSLRRQENPGVDQVIRSIVSLHNNTTIAEEYTMNPAQIGPLSRPPEPSIVTVGRSCTDAMKSAVDFELLKETKFWLLAGIMGCVQLAYYLPFIYTLEYAEELRVEKCKAVLLITIMGECLRTRAPFMTTSVVFLLRGRYLLTRPLTFNKLMHKHFLLKGETAVIKKHTLMYQPELSS